jgi:hypothetical protein
MPGIYENPAKGQTGGRFTEFGHALIIQNWVHITLDERLLAKIRLTREQARVSRLPRTNSLRAIHKYVHATAEHNKEAMIKFERAMKAEERKLNRGARPN